MSKKESKSEAQLKHETECLECGSTEGCEHCVPAGEVGLVEITDLVPVDQVAVMGEPASSEPDVQAPKKMPTMKMVEPATQKEQKMVEELAPDNRIEEEPPSHGQTAVKYGQILREQGHKRSKYFGPVNRR